MSAVWLVRRFSDALAYFFEHTHRSWVNRSVLVHAEVDRHCAAIFHALADVISQHLRIEPRFRHLNLLLDPIWFHDYQRLVAETLPRPAGISAVDPQLDRARRLPSPTTLPFSDVRINP